MSLFQPFKALGLAFLDLFFPCCCINCSERLPENLRILCAPCLQTMISADPQEHCRYCFRPLNEAQCTYCAKHPSPFHRAQAPFIAGECTLALANKLASETGTFLKDSLAAFITVQIADTQLPLPDLLIPFPTKGSLKLAQALSSQLHVPLLSCLERKITNEIILQDKQKPHLTDKQVTLISLGTESLQESAEAGFALAPSYPKSISALYFQISAY